MNRLFLSIFLLLTGCIGIKSVPYVAPDMNKPYAKLRVITNGNIYGDQINNCKPRERHKMAVAGRFYHNKKNDMWKPNVNYPQYPLVTSSMDMPKRVAPELPRMLGGNRMAEGLTSEVATEYNIPANASFMLSTTGAVSGSYGSTYSTCSAQERVYTFESGKNYEAVVGIVSLPDKTGEVKEMCVFDVYELFQITDSQISFRGTPLSFTEPPQAFCKD